MPLPFDPRSLRFEPLSDFPPRGVFTCGHDTVDRWLHEKAQKAHRQHCQVWTVSAPGEEEIVAFYAVRLTAQRVINATILDYLMPGASYFPALHVEWIAVRADLQRKGLGTILMGRILGDFLVLADEFCLPGLTLDALNDDAARFYRALGFIPYTPIGKRMLLNEASARKWLARTE